MCTRIQPTHPRTSLDAKRIFSLLFSPTLTFVCGNMIYSFCHHLNETVGANKEVLVEVQDYNEAVNKAHITSSTYRGLSSSLQASPSSQYR